MNDRPMGQSEAESSAESGPLDVVMNMFVGNRLLDDFLDGEGSIAGRVKISRLRVQSTLSGPPGLNFSQLH